MECGKCTKCTSENGRCDVVVSYERACRGYVALDEPIKNGPDTGVARDIIPDPTDEAEIVENNILFSQIIGCLRAGHVAPRAEFAIRCSFGLGGQDPMSHTEIGRQLGCSAVKVGRLIDEALVSLRECMGEAA
jgi:DNA-directed RNA polymerase sigma subunit (sigma70/sigma32)